MSQLFINRTGSPLEVTEFRFQPRPVPQAGEVLVRMLVSAINPADLNFIEGTYGTKPNFPCPLGMEGFGVIEALGKEVHGLAVGTPVLPLEGPGAWSQWRCLLPDQIQLLPLGIDPPQAALLRVNPLTAWGLLHSAGALPAGTWIVQNAASSAAGHCVIQLAKSLQLKTLNFVRRPESVPVCQALGADLVFLDDAEGLAAAKSAITANQAATPVLALNAVGGDSALRLCDLLGRGGTHITYGAMGRQALKVPNSMLIFKGLTLRGFWLTTWKTSLSSETLKSAYQNIIELVQAGKLRQQISATYPLASYREALTHASQNARNGKVLFTF